MSGAVQKMLSEYGRAKREEIDISLVLKGASAPRR